MPTISDSQEAITPEPGRWWSYNAGSYAREQRVERGWSETTVDNTVRCLRAWPDRFEASGLPRPIVASDITAEMILAWKSEPWGPGHYCRKPAPLRSTTAFQALHTLRGFLAWANSPVAKKEALWRSRRGDATRRRWLPKESLDRLWTACRSDRERLVVAATAWAGLRRNELWALRVGDCRLDADAPSITVTRKGGRHQWLPISRSVADAIRPFSADDASARVYPMSYNVIDRDLRRIGARIGLKEISAHDLRRTFGRLLYYEWRQDINDIRSLLGHSTTEMTLYYVGARADTMRRAVDMLAPPTPLALAQTGVD